MIKLDLNIYLNFIQNMNNKENLTLEEIIEIQKNLLIQNTLTKNVLELREQIKETTKILLESSLIYK